MTLTPSLPTSVRERCGYGRGSFWWAKKRKRKFLNLPTPRDHTNSSLSLSLVALFVGDCIHPALPLSLSSFRTPTRSISIHKSSERSNCSPRRGERGSRTYLVGEVLKEHTVVSQPHCSLQKTIGLPTEKTMIVAANRPLSDNQHSNNSNNRPTATPVPPLTTMIHNNNINSNKDNDDFSDHSFPDPDFSSNNSSSHYLEQEVEKGGGAKAAAATAAMPSLETHKDFSKVPSPTSQPTTTNTITKGTIATTATATDSKMEPSEQQQEYMNGHANNGPNHDGSSSFHHDEDNGEEEEAAATGVAQSTSMDCSADPPSTIPKPPQQPSAVPPSAAVPAPPASSTPPVTNARPVYEDDDDVSITIGGQPTTTPVRRQSRRTQEPMGIKEEDDEEEENNDSNAAKSTSAAAQDQSFNPWANNQSLNTSAHSAATATRMVSFVPGEGGGGGGGGSDPPSSFGGGQQQHHRAAPDPMGDDVSVYSQSTRHTTHTTTTNNIALLSHPLVESHRAVRVMKGEIRNVLTVMRSSEHMYISAQRFTEEVTQESHPLVQQFQDMNFTLSDWDLQMAAQALYRRRKASHQSSAQYQYSNPPTGGGDGTSSTVPQKDPIDDMTPDTLMYLPPFCLAISTREINASVTGACLTALHKFLLYGFVHNARDAQMGMTMIARALLQCTFEETNAAAAAAAAAATAGAANAKNQQQQRNLKKQQANSTSITGVNSVLSSEANNNNNELSSRTLGVNKQQQQQSQRGGLGIDKNNDKNHNGKDGESEPQQPYYHQQEVNDEQVVLKLLDLAALVVRCSFLGTIVSQQQQEDPGMLTSQATGCLIDADLVVGLLDTCLHVSHIAKSASPLLKSAAQDALAQIVLQVFSHKQPPPPPPSAAIAAPIPTHLSFTMPSRGMSSRSLGGNYMGGSTVSLMKMNDHVGETDSTKPSPRQQVLSKLASLLNPASHDEQVIISSLTAVNIALETASNEGEEGQMSKQEIVIVQNDLFKYLLQWSTTSDLHILSLTCRVIFNLFQSIPNHLKVPLEVFLTSVHLRILDSSSALRGGGGGGGGKLGGLAGGASSSSSSAYAANHEEREVVLESILEFCQEPVLMQDIYRNYDCDVACTNLYELIVGALGKTAMPNDSTHPIMMGNAASALKPSVAAPAPSSSSETTTENSSSGGGRGGATNSTATTKTPITLTPSASATVITPASRSFFTVSPQTTPIMQLNKLALEGLCAILNSIARKVHADRSPFLREMGPLSSNMSTTDMMDSFMMNSMADVSSVAPSSTQQQLSEEELHQRRQRKHALVQVAELFNEDCMGQGWLDMAVNLDILDAADNAAAVAEVLYSTPGLDKATVGIYLSKGPDSDYPFNAKVREQFLYMYDFSELGFASALRLFLSKFRLPGEAQCIDRFMESFSSELFRQQGGEMCTFKDSDAVYVLSFSTIMLNTDLHNPTIKETNRMTKEQFIKNNRGINGGEDLPGVYLSQLYDQIKDNQIQVQREVGEFMKKQEDDENFRSAWDSILAKHREVATAFFTPAGHARRNVYRAGVHEKEMFTILVKWTLVALPAVFNRSWDDGVVFRSLRGFKQMAMIADHFGLDDVVNEIIELLLSKGRDYVVNCITMDHNPKTNTTIQKDSSNRSLETDGEDETTTHCDTQGESDSQIPYSLLSSGKGYTVIDYAGAAHHRGLLALDTGFLLVRRYARKVISAWPLFIECLCAMRDAHALPTGLSDLDDFADSNGNVLPLSPYAKVSQRRLDHFYASKAASDARRGVSSVTDGQPQQEGWFSKLFKTSPTFKMPTSEELENAKTEDIKVSDGGGMSESTRAVLGVAEAANVEKIVQMGSTKLPVAEQTIRSLLDVVDSYPYDDDPVAEQHAIFSLELAARALLSNRDRAVEIFPVFLAKFESVLGKVSENSIPSPFVIERIVVTILRCSIHLYDIEELRPNLRVSLHLLIMSIPKSFVRDVADRMACGLAIILRASFPFFESHNEWTFMGDTFDRLASYSSARVFVFDGIASTVECAVPHQNKTDKDESGYGYMDDDYENETADDSKNGQYSLTKEACGALSRILIRFVLGFYQGDLSLAVPASVCLEKLYLQMNSLALEEEAAAAAKAGNPIEITERDRKSRVPNKDYWQNVTVALYSVCRSPDPDVSRHGYEICQRVILRTSLREIPAEKWLGILHLMVSKQPPTAADLSRANTFVLLGNMLMRVLPYLSKKQRPLQSTDAEKKDGNMVDGEDLTDVVRQTAILAGENLRNGRRGRVSPLFEKTLQTLTYLSNHMQTDDWKGDKEFGLWASEALLAELEKVGAAGASLQNQVAIQQRPTDDDDEDQPEILDREPEKVEANEQVKTPEESQDDSDDDDD